MLLYSKQYFHFPLFVCADLDFTYCLIPNIASQNLKASLIGSQKDVFYYLQL